MSILSRHGEIDKRIARAAERAGRKTSGITLIAVAKTVSADLVREAFALGIRDFGENRVQELAEKRQGLADLPIRWHMIGHLQTNKVRLLLPDVSMIHSVDSLHLAQRLQELAPADRSLDVCLQINTSGEPSKFGIPPDALPELIRGIRPLARLRVRGLMTLGPLTDDEGAIRSSFVLLREMQAILRDEFPDATVLSMGMSGDFEIAIEEGATHIRVGTALFGPRE